MATAALRIETQASSALRRVTTWLKPLDGGPQEIKSLDGLRALAALLVVELHFWDTFQPNQPKLLLGRHAHSLWYFGQTGVLLFFVLSGFLLFLPYVRAMLDARPTPSARTFYRRRALRIVPAYLVCLAVQLAYQWPQFASAKGMANIGLHLVFLHDVFDSSVFALDAPFWTLAVEVQFYLLLPLFALAIATCVGSSKSVWRILAGPLAIMALALLLRAGAALSIATIGLHAAPIVDYSLRLLIGVQGKYIEVFALGMLISVLYVVAIERKSLSVAVARWVGAVCVALALISGYYLALWHGFYLIADAAGYTDVFVRLRPSFLSIGGPWLLSLCYALLVTGVLFSERLVRAPFEFTPLRSIGHISYSVYLWHWPIVLGLAPFTQQLPVIWRLVVAFAVSYLSYQLIERTFLTRRRRVATPVTSEGPIAVAVAPPATGA